MAKIENEGRFSVKITDIKFVDDLNWENDPQAYKLVFWGETPDGLIAKADMIFSSSEFWDNREKKNVTSAAKSQKLLEDCGVPGGNIAELPKILSGEIEFNCVFVGKLKEASNGDKFLNFYINPVGTGKPIADADFGNLATRFAAMTGKKEPVVPPTPPVFPVEDATPPAPDTTQNVMDVDDDMSDVPF